MESIFLEWDSCFKKDYFFYKAFKKSSRSPSVFENFDIECDYLRLGIEYYGGMKTQKNAKSKKNSMSLSVLQVIEKNQNKSQKTIQAFDFLLVNNEKGKYCESYPEKFLLPTILSKSHIENICKFRARERLPILTFSYQNDKKGKKITKENTFLWRGSQVRTGMFNNRCFEDEFLVDLMHNPKKHKVNLKRITKNFWKSETSPCS